MATSSSSAMKWSLVVVLLLSAVVASQAHQVSCKNTCMKAVVFDGIWTDVGETTVLEVENVIVVEVHEGEGVKHVVKFKCPESVKALEFVHEGGEFVKAQITDVIGLGSTLHSGRRTLRESERLGGSLKPVSKQRRLLQDDADDADDDADGDADGDADLGGYVDAVHAVVDLAGVDGDVRVGVGN